MRRGTASSASAAGPDVLELPSPNRGPRPAGATIDTLVLHYTGMTSAAAAIDRLRDPAASVSSHYVVDEDGTVVRLVPEDAMAFHAGLSCWRGRERLNEVSVGIEIVNPGHEHGYRPFPAAQMDAVAALCRAILGRHPIPARNVVAHSDIAPNRKQDPGELFPWRWLAGHGVGLWPGPDGDQAPDPESALAAIGYRLDDHTHTLPVVLAAFQRHWRADAVTGMPDRETRARLAAVQRACNSG